MQHPSVETDTNHNPPSLALAAGSGPLLRLPQAMPLLFSQVPKVWTSLLRVAFCRQKRAHIKLSWTGREASSLLLFFLLQHPHHTLLQSWKCSTAMAPDGLHSSTGTSRSCSERRCSSFRKLSPQYFSEQHLRHLDWRVLDTHSPNPVGLCN